MTFMKALLCKAFGPADTLVLEDLPSPEPKKNEVLIEVQAAGVNFPDTLIIEGKYQFKPPFPFAPGGEVAGVVKAVGEMNEDEILWCYDDTLIGKGANGTDAILIVLPEVEKPRANKINTNAFADLSPGLAACTLQYCDMAAPREIPTPLAGGAIDVLSELRVTSGWGVRPEAIAIVSMQYQ
jgi:NADPH:quinone reductase-like Zn-dependent oxidoreductase